jgi:hypothetical protein
MVLNSKLKATTLVETIVAITILSLVSALAIMIFLMVSKPSSNSGSLLLAQQKSREVFNEMDNTTLQEALPIEWKLQNLNFYVSFSDYAEQLREVEIEVKDNEERTIYVRKQVFYWYEP